MNNAQRLEFRRRMMERQSAGPGATVSVGPLAKVYQFTEKELDEAIEAAVDKVIDYDMVIEDHVERNIACSIIKDTFNHQNLRVN